MKSEVQYLLDNGLALLSFSPLSSPCLLVPKPDGTSRFCTDLTARASDISAFVTPDSFPQYTVMAFGMKNAPATFQRVMNQVLFDVPLCEAYLDDVIIYTETWD